MILNYKGSDGFTANTRAAVIDHCLETGTTPFFEWRAPTMDYDSIPRVTGASLDDAVKNRLQQLRAANDKFYLWYSGGLDSHLALYGMIKHKIFPDRIYLMEWDPNDGKYPFPYSVEASFGTDYVNQLLKDGKLPSTTEFHVIRVGGDESTRYFSEPNATRFTELVGLRHTIQGLAAFPYLYRGEFDMSELHLRGGNHPIIYWNPEIQRWQFRYIDTTWGDAPYHNNAVNFTMGDKDIHTVYINNMIDEMEKAMANEEAKREDFHWENIIHMRNKNTYRDEIPLMAKLKKELGPQAMKFIPIDTTGKHPSEVANSTCGKTWVTFEMGKRDNAPWYQAYMNNMDWEFVKKGHEIGGIISNTFTVEP